MLCYRNFNSNICSSTIKEFTTFNKLGNELFKIRNGTFIIQLKFYNLQ